MVITQQKTTPTEAMSPLKGSPLAEMNLLPLPKGDYGKCPKILYTKVTDKTACTNSADPDQTAPEGAVWSGSTLFAIPLLLETTALKARIWPKKCGMKCSKF